MLFQLTFELFDKPRDQGALLTQCGNDVCIGHPHMVGCRLVALNTVVVPFAREYREFCSSRPPSATIGLKSIAEFNLNPAVG
jgi:hypothetical protein